MARKLNRGSSTPPADRSRGDDDERDAERDESAPENTEGRTRTGAATAPADKPGRRLRNSDDDNADESPPADDSDPNDGADEEDDGADEPEPPPRSRRAEAQSRPTRDEEDDERDPPTRDERKPASPARTDKPARADSTALAKPGKLDLDFSSGVAARLGNFEDDQRLGTGESFPYLAFFNDRMDRAGEIEGMLGEQADGAPVLHVGGGEWIDAAGLELLVLAHFPYWCTLDESTYQPDEITLAPQPYSSDPDGFKKNVLAIVLVVSGDKDKLPGELEPGIATLTTFRSTKSAIVERHVAAVRRTTQPGWAKDGGATEQALMSWPKNYRIASSMVIKSVPSKRRKGKTYTKGEARPHTLTVDQAHAVKAFLTDPERMAELDEIVRQFDQQVAGLKERDGRGSSDRERRDERRREDRGNRRSSRDDERDDERGPARRDPRDDEEAPRDGRGDRDARRDSDRGARRPTR